MAASEKNQRIVEAAAAILAAAPSRRMNTVVLNKALFYLDLAALRDFGEVVTQSPFIALEQGPVVAQYPKRLIKPLEDAGIAVQEEHGMAKPICLKRELQNGAGFMDEPLVDLAGKIACWMGQQTSGSVSEYSHENPGWKLAYDQGLGGEGKAHRINLLIAMQQIVDTDPWLVEPLNLQERRAVEAADNLERSEW